MESAVKKEQQRIVTQSKRLMFERCHFIRGGFFVCVLCVLLLLPFFVSAGAPLKQQPNIIVILADDMGWKDLSYIDDSFNETPNIDRLARKGAFFSQAYAPAPSCTPSRASLLTGKSTARLQTYIVASTRGESDRRRRLEQLTNRFFGPIRNVKSLGNYFLEAGYKTAYVGKWNVGIHDKPKDHGYQEQFAASRVGMPQNYFAPWGIDGVKANQMGEYLTDTLTQKATQFINKSKSDPFLLVLSYYAPHVPWQAKTNKVDYFRKKDTLLSSYNPVYAAMLSAIDDGVGRVILALQQSGELDNTIIVFASDNGPEKLTGEVAPFKGYKSTATEGGLRVPLIFYGPRYLPASIQNKPVSLESLTPTLLSMAGIVTPKNTFDGKSFAGLLRGENKSDELGNDVLFWHLPAYSPGVSENSIWFSLTPVSIVRDGDWKLVEDYHAGDFKLFNTALDPEEKMNLYHAYPKRALQLKKQLRLKQKQTSAVIPVPIEPAYLKDKKIKKIMASAKRILFLVTLSYAASVNMLVIKTGIVWWLLLILIFFTSSMLALTVNYWANKYSKPKH